MAETDQTAGEPLHFRIRREARGVVARFRATVIPWFRGNWREKRWFRWASIALLALAVLWLLVWALLTRGLPDAETLLSYEPPLPSVVRGIDGEIVHSYARERRVQLQYKDFPAQLVNAYTSAEDETFWTHGGVDITGTLNAAFDYASKKIGGGGRAIGGSTITQQVAKNILLGNEYSVTRKLKEMILARRIESVLSKREIMELYLNEIPLGRRSFGVQAAARAYFDKDVGDLALHEMAYLAILPKAPETYSREKGFAEATTRRNFVLDVMAENGHITQAQAAAAKAEPLGLIREQPQTRSADAGYFLEEVRRQLIEKYGEQAEDGPLSVYAGGLWVRTSLDTELQTAAQKSLRDGPDALRRRSRLARSDRHDRSRQRRPDQAARLVEHRHQLPELARRRGHRPRRQLGADRFRQRRGGPAHRIARRDQGWRRHRGLAQRQRLGGAHRARSLRRLPR